MSRVAFEVPVLGGVITGEDFGGTGPDVILVHGLGYTVEMWRALGPLLARHARVISFDLRGHGQSSCSADEPVELLRDFARVIDATGMQRPVLVAYQYGGLVAAYVAALNPGLIGAVCLIDSPVTEPSSTVAQVLAMFETDEVLQELETRFAFGRTGHGTDSFERFIDEISAKHASDWLVNTTSPEVAREGALRTTLVLPDGTWIRQPKLAAFRDFATFPREFSIAPGRELLEDLSIPVWSLQPAEGDFAQSFDDFSAIARRHPGWAARLLPGNLYVPQSNPERIEAELADLLTTLKT